MLMRGKISKSPPSKSCQRRHPKLKMSTSGLNDSSEKLFFMSSGAMYSALFRDPLLNLNCLMRLSP